MACLVTGLLALSTPALGQDALQARVIVDHGAPESRIWAPGSVSLPNHYACVIVDHDAPEFGLPGAFYSTTITRV